VVLCAVLCGPCTDSRWIGWGTEKNNAVLGWGANKNKIPIRTPSKTTNIGQAHATALYAQRSCAKYFPSLVRGLRRGLVRTRLWLFFEALCAQDPSLVCTRLLLGFCLVRALCAQDPSFQNLHESLVRPCASLVRLFFIWLFFQYNIVVSAYGQYHPNVMKIVYPSVPMWTQ